MFNKPFIEKSFLDVSLKTKRFEKDQKKLFGYLFDDDVRSLEQLLLSWPKNYCERLLNLSTPKKELKAAAYLFPAICQAALLKAKSFEAMEILTRFGASLDKEYKKGVFLTDIILDKQDYVKFKYMLSLEAQRQNRHLNNTTPKHWGQGSAHKLSDKGLFNKLCRSYGTAVKKVWSPEQAPSSQIIDCFEEFERLNMIQDFSLAQYRASLIELNASVAHLPPERLRDLTIASRYLLDKGVSVNVCLKQLNGEKNPVPMTLFIMACRENKEDKETHILLDFLLDYYRNDLAQLNLFKDQLYAQPGYKEKYPYALKTLGHYMERLELHNNINASSTHSAENKKKFKL